MLTLGTQPLSGPGARISQWNTMPSALWGQHTQKDTRARLCQAHVPGGFEAATSCEVLRMRVQPQLLLLSRVEWQWSPHRAVSQRVCAALLCTHVLLPAPGRASSACCPWCRPERFRRMCSHLMITRVLGCDTWSRGVAGQGLQGERHSPVCLMSSTCCEAWLALARVWIDCEHQNKF